MSIKLLAPQVIARIAAGEVVERPASVVKELVENSLDAAARQITIEVRGGGTSLIRVSDNGTGIPEPELELAFQRHATSKVTSLDDLEAIASLGFRGEALPSIAAVAEVEVVTGTQEAATGSYLNLKEGVVVKQGSQGRPQGTTMTIRNLFRNVPARLKFLKSPSTENSHVTNIVSQYALAFPEVKFTLLIDGKIELRTPGNGRLIDGIIEMYGARVAQNMLELNGGNGGWNSAESRTRVAGMVGSPSIARASRDYLSFFVNRRWINSRLLAWAVEEAYHGLLMTGKHPLAIINLSLPPNEVDVNIHPAKSEVKFQNERLVFSAVQKAVRQALIELAPVPRIEEVSPTYSSRPSASQPLWVPTETDITGHQALPTIQPTPARSLPALRLLGQLASNYIIAEGADGLYLIDQHAAHERILFEKIRDQINRRAIDVQALLEPATFEVTPVQEIALKSSDENLAELGFSVEPFGNRTYLVRTVPLLLQDKDWMAALGELLDSSLADNRDVWTEKVAISLACHGAIRAGQVLSDDEMRGLLRQLEQAATPNTCPHGRPTLIRLGIGQLEKEFGRS